MCVRWSLLPSLGCNRRNSRLPPDEKERASERPLPCQVRGRRASDDWLLFAAVHFENSPMGPASWAESRSSVCRAPPLCPAAEPSSRYAAPREWPLSIFRPRQWRFCFLFGLRAQMCARGWFDNWLKVVCLFSGDGFELRNADFGQCPTVIIITQLGWHISVGKTNFLRFDQEWWFFSCVENKKLGMNESQVKPLSSRFAPLSFQLFCSVGKSRLPGPVSALRHVVCMLLLLLRAFHRFCSSHSRAARIAWMPLSSECSFTAPIFISSEAVEMFPKRASRTGIT